MSLYQTSNKELHDKYHRADNAVTKNVYRDILANRAKLGSSDAKRYLKMIDASRVV